MRPSSANINGNGNGTLTAQLPKGICKSAANGSANQSAPHPRGLTMTPCTPTRRPPKDQTANANNVQESYVSGRAAPLQMTCTMPRLSLNRIAGRLRKSSGYVATNKTAPSSSPMAICDSRDWNNRSHSQASCNFCIACIASHERSLLKNTCIFCAPCNEPRTNRPPPQEE